MGEPMRNLRRRSHRLAATIAIALTGAFTLVGLQWRASEAVAAQKSSQSLATDQASFLSDTGRLQRDPGTPVGPPKRIIICHRTGNGESHTIRVNESAVPAH